MLILKLFLSALTGVLMAELCIRLHIKDNLKKQNDRSGYHCIYCTYYLCVMRHVEIAILNVEME